MVMGGNAAHNHSLSRPKTTIARVVHKKVKNLARMNGNAKF
jgi:hypothetical protein